MTEGIIQKVLDSNKLLNIYGKPIGYKLKTKQELIAEIHDLLSQDAKRHLHTSASYILEQLTGLVE